MRLGVVVVAVSVFGSFRGDGGAGVLSAQVTAQNPIVIENAQAGATDWDISSAGDPTKDS